MKLEACDDFLHCLHKLLDDPLPKFGPTVLLRSALETSARAWWLLDPNLDAQQRGARGIAEQYVSLTESINTASVMSTDDEIEQVRIARRDLHALATAEGLTIHLDKRDRLLDVAGEARPTATRLIERFAGKDSVLFFRDFSGVAHGLVSALIHRYRTEHSDRGSEFVHVIPDVPIEELSSDIAITMWGYLSATGRRMTVYGWNSREWDAWRRHIATTFRAILAST